MATTCGYEFQASHFGFIDTSPHQFYHLQWTKNRWIYMVYRFLTFGYQLSWFVVDFATDLGENAPEEKVQYLLLSNWSEVVMLIYFLIAFLVSIVGVARRKNDLHSNADSPSWYQKVNWVFFNIATTAAFIITIFYWAVVGRTRTVALNTRPRTIHLHVTNSILALLDIFMVAFPTRFLHFIYTVAYGVVYGIFLLIMHWTGVDSKIYPVLDWANAPGVAAGWLILAVVVMPVVIQAIAFGFYHLRACIARATVLKGETQSSGERVQPPVEMGNVNPAFESTPNHKPTEIPT